MNDEFYQIRQRPDRWIPERRARKLKLVKTGTWFFGLLNTYRIEYTDWEYL